MSSKPRHRISVSGLRRVFGHFIPHLRPHRRTLAIAGLCMLGVTAMELLRPWPLKFVFDVILAPDAGDPAETRLLLSLIAGVILLIAVLGGLFSFGQAYLAASVGQKVVAEIRRRVYSHLQRLSHSYHDDSSTGDLLERLTGDIRMMRDLLVNAVVYISDRSLVLVGMLVIMLWMDWQLTLVALTVLPLLLLTVVRFSRNIKKATRKQRRKESELSHTMTEKISSITVVQAFAREAYEDEQFEHRNAKSTKAGLVTTKLEANMSRLVQIVLAVGTAGVLWFGVVRVQAGYLTPGDLLVFTAYLAGLYKPVRKLASLTSRVAKATACGERVVSILETEPEIRDAVDAIPAPAFHGGVEFRRVSFAYPGGAPVLREASFHLNRGETVALIGESGQGKSTIGRLMLRFYDPQAGGIFIDGRDIRCYTLESLRSQIAVVLQESVLFNASVRDNIAYGKLDATDEEIVAAARAANAHAFIEKLPDGYDTILSERGASLSGGQRQRIAVARAMVRDAAIVILDEPTTGLDTDSRKEVESALIRLTADRICLLITHNMDRASQAERILQIRDGKVVEVSAEQRQLVGQSREGTFSQAAILHEAKS